MGLDIARSLAREEISVFLGSRREDAVAETVTTLRNEGAEVDGCALDVSRPSEGESPPAARHGRRAHGAGALADRQHPLVPNLCRAYHEAEGSVGEPPAIAAMFDMMVRFHGGVPRCHA